jgi:hypothetical protein
VLVGRDADLALVEERWDVEPSIGRAAGYVRAPDRPAPERCERGLR